MLEGQLDEVLFDWPKEEGSELRMKDTNKYNENACAYICGELLPEVCLTFAKMRHTQDLCDLCNQCTCTAPTCSGSKSDGKSGNINQLHVLLSHKVSVIACWNS